MTFTNAPNRAPSLPVGASLNLYGGLAIPGLGYCQLGAGYPAEPRPELSVGWQLQSPQVGELRQSGVDLPAWSWKLVTLLWMRMMLSGKCSVGVSGS